MARKTNVAEDIPVVEPVTAAAPEPEMIHCRDCKHWRRPWPTANMGECGVSRRFMPSPVMTTDLASCSQAER